MDVGCIIASTPLQIISACIIAGQYRGYEFDLYIIGNFSSYKDIQDKLSHYGLFINVVSYKLDEIRNGYNSKSKIKKSIGSLISYMHYHSLKNKIIVSDRSYKIVFFAAAISAIELLFYMKDRFKPEFVMYDDGVMTYRNVNHCLGNEGKVKYIKKVFEIIHGRFAPSLLLYMPDLFYELNGRKYKVITLDHMSDQVIDIVKKIYNVPKDTQIKEDIIVLECKADDYLNDHENDEIEKIYTKLDDIYGDSVIYKRHPRDKRELVKGRKYLEGQIPYEVYNLLQDMSSKTIVAWDSTAVLTPKLFFDQEPKVVLMYKIFHGKLKRINFETHRLYMAFKETYLDQKRFIIPESIDGLLAYLGIIKNEN